jgi:ferredoxin-NADP reductase
MEHSVKILEIEELTHDVRRFVVEKPEGYGFVPGQATLVSIDKDVWKDEKRPFTFTGLVDDDKLEFVIKEYVNHNGVTKELFKCEVGDKLFIRDVWGAIKYDGNGVFIAGGVGITPFIAIFRDLKEKEELEGNKLIYSNKTSKDIVLEDELKEMFGEDLILVFTREKKEGCHDKRIDKDFLKEKISDFSQNFYICGPKLFTADVKKMLEELGAEVESIIIEE